MARFNDSDDPRRRLLLQALAAGLLGGGSVRAALAGPFGNVPKELPPGRSIYTLKGDVRVNAKPATLDTRITTHDVIETGKDGEIIFVVGKDSFLLRSNSRLLLTPDLTQRRTTAQEIVGNIKLFAGKMLTAFAKRAHRIETPTVVVGIRGTGVYLETSPDESYLCTCYGLVDIRAAGDAASKETIEATHHDKPRYITKGRGDKLIRPAPMINHTDQELMLVETLVGRTPPFVFPQDDYNAPRREY
jgi:hypothetical protein